MPVNDFEKQVQQKMDELQLRPSGEVWTEVEKRIRKEKQRRRFVLWFFITGAILLGGTAWWLNTNDHSSTKTVAQQKTEGSTVSPNDPANTAADKNNNPTGTTTTNNNDINTGTTVSQQPVQSTNDKSIDKSINPTTNPVANTPTGNDKKNREPAIDKNISSSDQGVDVTTTRSPVGRRRGNGKDKADDKTPDRVTDPVIKIDADKTVPSQSKPTDAAIQKTVVNKPVNTDKTTSPTINKNNSDQPKADPLLKDSLVVKITDPVIPDNTPSQPIKIKKKESKWEFGITGGGGVSTITDGFPIFKISAEKSLFYDSNVNPNALQGAYPAAYQLVPSDPEEGPYWQIGAYAKRKLSDRLGVSAGLQYSSFSTTQTIGKYVPLRTSIGNNAYSSNVQYYYRSGDVATYRNHYNYIQIPVALHWQINKGKKLPITWQNGVTVGRLAKSDALIYTPNSNLFYHDNSLLNKTQFSMQSGFSARLLNKTKHPVSIGFLFNYHFSDLQRVQASGRNNMTSFGVNASWIIKK